VLEPITAEVIASAPNLKLIQKIGVGVNTIDLEAARARAVAVCNMPGTNTRAVAEMTLLLMLGSLRRIAQLDRATRAGEGWSLPADLQDRLGEIHGRTVGFVGYGGVPRMLAPILAAMGARLLYTATAPKDGAEADWRDLDALLGESDIVSLHAPLTEKTGGMISAEAIAKIKPGAVLVNTARGELVDQKALAEALSSGRLGAAGIDVFAHEPVPADDSLLSLDNVVVAPHFAWLTAETLERSLSVAIENCRRLGDADTLLHRVC
jgi:phosphoglycerate dehydrogenase-like enzyme